MLGCLLELLLEPIMWLVLYVLLLPIFLVLATPWVLIRAIFGPGDYFTAVTTRYEAIISWWGELGDGCLQRTE